MIKVTDVIDYVHRFTLNMTNLNTAHKRKDTSRLYRIVQDDFATTVTTKWKSGLKVNIQRCIPSMLHGFVFFSDGFVHKKKAKLFPVHKNVQSKRRSPSGKFVVLICSYSQ